MLTVTSNDVKTSLEHMHLIKQFSIFPFDSSPYISQSLVVIIQSNVINTIITLSYPAYFV
jgi:hypothetical protein